MRNVAEVMVAVAFALPKMDAEFGAFFRAIVEEIFDEAQHDDFADFKFEVFPWEKNFVVGNESQHALVICWQLRVDVNPIQFH